MGIEVNSKTLKNIWVSTCKALDSGPVSIDVPIEDVIEISAKKGHSLKKTGGIGKFKETILKFFTKHKSLGLDRNIVSQLDKLEGDDFISAAYKFICENYRLDGKKIPPELLPKIVKIDVGCGVNAYCPSQNLFIVNPKYNVTNRSLSFGLIKHEMTHFLQALNIFRTKGLGKKASGYFAQSEAKRICQALANTAKSLSDEEFAKLSSDPNFQIMAQYRQLLKTSQQSAEDYMQQIMSATTANLYKANETRRQLIIKHFGEIKPTCEEAKKAKRDFLYFKKGTTGLQTAEQIKKYFDQRAEKEAYKQTFFGIAEYLFPEMNALCK